MRGQAEGCAEEMAEITWRSRGTEGCAEDMAEVRQHDVAPC